MTRVVHKTQLTNMTAKIMVSAGAFKVLTVHEQHGIPTVWYETLEKDVIPIEVRFEAVPTGGDVPDHSVYVGTAFCNTTVWHIYQIPAL